MVRGDGPAAGPLQKDALLPENATYRPTLIERIAARTARLRHPRQDGLAMLDVVIGMAIFALIVIIAVRSVGSFRQRGIQTQVFSDARQVSTGLESFFTDTQVYPDPVNVPGNYAATGISTADLTTMGVNLTKNVQVGGYTKDDAAGTYTFCTIHITGGTAVDAWALYDSSKGAITATGRGSLPSSGPGSTCDD